jgi:hypothetical protein
MRHGRFLAALAIACVIALYVEPLRAALPVCERFPLLRSDPVLESNLICSPDANYLIDDTLSYGGEVRQRYEYTRNPSFGAGEQDPHGVWLERYALYGRYRWHGVQLFAELQSVLENGRAGGPSPVDRDELEFQNLFLQTRLPVRSADIELRLGRQEMQFGSARLISVRDGPNVRRTFDGIRAAFRAETWTVDVIAAHPRKDRPGAFDDTTDTHKALWGVYATGALGLGSIDVYFLGYRNDHAVFDQGAAREQRDTVGIRYFGSYGGWQWNLEPMVQFGQFGSGALFAWTVASETAYTWSDVKWQPTLKLSVNVASGDRNRSDSDLETFNPLFPRGNYFSEDSILGPYNFYNAHLFLTLHLSEIWSITIDHNWFWRFSSGDGVYGPPGNLVRSGVGSASHFVATGLSVNSEWSIGRQWYLTAIYTRVSPQQFLKETGPAEKVDFIELTTQFRF